MTRHIHPDGFIVVGFALDRGYLLTELDQHAEAAGLTKEHRFATWDLRPFKDDVPFAVTIFRLKTRAADDHGRLK